MNNKKKGIPKLDGSGRGIRANRGRGGCEQTEPVGKGRYDNWLRRPRRRRFF